MAKAYVYSTLAADTTYKEWVKTSDLHIEARSVTIKGGTGVANDRIVTPLGVRTEIDAELVEVLKANEIFKLHQKNGFVVIEDVAEDPEKVAADMTSADNSAPLTESSFENAGDAVAKPTSSKKK
ncbi:hypothetical protein [Curvibacter lanceolatus]|uniref:hypothetical protein n=1 Tax=Curvibacter lanceolatus TaxID=86182 RepID=UPI00036D70E7|nr:hypothetical protein [Curvibacter lanceolatus]